MKKVRSFLLMSLISASLLVSVFTILQAQNSGGTAAKATKWSDPATWPNRKVPVAGDKITIDAGKEVVLDVNTPPLNGLTIERQARASPMTKTLNSPPSGSWCTASWRSAPKPGPTRRRRPSLSPTTSKAKTSADWAGITSVDRGIMLMGGTLNLHGTGEEHLDQAVQDRRKRQHLDRGPERGWLEASARRSFSHPRISIPGRQSGEPFPPSAETRSRSTRNWTTCTSARSRSTWMNAAKSAC